jgi:hypothetical protein
MPIFPRRQLQLMLDELGPWLTKAKATDLRNRIESEDPDQCIPGEYELGLGWALSKTAELKISPSFGSKNPDFLSANLFPDRPAVIEVTALSDDPLSGQSSMERTANIINQFANRVRKKASNNLHYTFLETSGYRPVKLKVPIGPWTHRSQYYRKRLTSKKFILTVAHEAQLRKWLVNWPPPQPLRIAGQGTDVVVSWKEWVHPFTKTFSSMPSSEIHDLTNNPVYERLREKEKQLAAVPADYLKCIVLGDAGCQLLFQPNQQSDWSRRVSGKDIILHFLEDSDIDLVCILSPRRRNEHASWDNENPRLWHLYIFEKSEHTHNYYDRLNELCDRLPRPYLHGYQARSLVQQGMIGPQTRGHYLPTSYSGGGGHGVTARISARALLELLAGRMNEQHLKYWITGDKNLFEYWLSQGNAVSDIAFEPKGPDKDDDYVVLKFSQDPNAAPLNLPKQLLDSVKS